MIWLEIITTNGQKHLINVNHVIDVYYSAESNMTIITMDRAHFGAFYIRGNKATEISKIIARNDKSILHKIGE